MALRPAAAIYHRFCFDDSGWGPLSDLFTSAMLGEASELERLVADTASPPLDAADAHGCTALHHAALSSSVAAVLVLLEAGADASARDATGATPLHVAAYNGRLDACKLLVLHGASVHARDEGGHTPLYDATFEASNRGACPCAADSSELQRGRTASFLRAVMAMPPHAAQAHVARSCEIAISARLQDALVDGGAGAFARLLRRCRRFVDARDYDGSTALHAASEAGDAQAVRLLLEAAADVAATTNCGETALHFAAREGHSLVVAALLEAGADALAASRSSTNPVDEARRRSQRTADSGGGGAGVESVLSLLEARLAVALPPDHRPGPGAKHPRGEEGGEGAALCRSIGGGGEGEVGGEETALCPPRGTFVVRTDERGLGLVAASPVEAGGCFARDTPVSVPDGDGGRRPPRSTDPEELLRELSTSL